MKAAYKIFVDLDGVLVDFDGGVVAITGKRPEEQDKSAMWPALARARSFYEHLDWMPDGRTLWQFLAPYEPTVLTGLPLGNWAEPQKRAWCRRELGESVPVITCMARDKAKRAGAATPPGLVPLLLDDREDLGERWLEGGGVFIHHRDARTTIHRLSRLL